MLQWFKKRQPTPPGIIGIEFAATQLGIAWLLRQDGQWQIKQHSLIPLQGAQQVASQLADWVEQHQAKHAPCHAVLSPAHYQLFLLDAPNVADDELRDAMRWKVKDLLEYPLDQAVIDVFRLPAGSQRGKQQMVYVVAAKQAEVEQAISWLQDAGLEVQSIDIAELAMRNLLHHLSAEQKSGLGLVQLAHESGHMLICKQGELYLSRHIEMGLRELNASAQLRPTPPVAENQPLPTQVQLDQAVDDIDWDAPSFSIAPETQEPVEPTAPALASAPPLEADFDRPLVPEEPQEALNSITTAPSQGPMPITQLDDDWFEQDSASDAADPESTVTQETATDSLDDLVLDDSALSLVPQEQASEPGAGLGLLEHTEAPLELAPGLSTTPINPPQPVLSDELISPSLVEPSAPPHNESVSESSEQPPEPGLDGVTELTEGSQWWQDDVAEDDTDLASNTSDEQGAAFFHAEVPEAFDKLLVEIQRSLDYYDSQLAQPPLSALWLLPSGSAPQALEDYLSKNIAAPLEPVVLSDVMQVSQPIEQVSWVAIGAALRQEAE